jgi:hypothetical protein
MTQFMLLLLLIIFLKEKIKENNRDQGIRAWLAGLQTWGLS